MTASMERPTPETDAEEYNCSIRAEYGDEELVVPSEHARRLEQQRDALEEALRRIRAEVLEEAARIAQSTVCDTHLPTGVRIYGTRAAAAIRAAKEGS